MPAQLLVYGAYGYTGKLVARRAIERGLAPILAGRDSERLVAIARELRCEWRAFPLSDPEALRRGIRGAGAVAHCAGPFVHTAAPMAEACIDERIHYLDLSGEIPALEALVARGTAARNAGVMLLPGAGFEVVPTDCLAAYLARRLPGARALTLAIAGFDRYSRGTARTILEQAGSSSRRTTGAPANRTFDLGFGPVTAAAIPLPDTFTAPRSTGIPEVATYVVTGPASRLLLRAAPRVAGLLRSARVREAVASLMAETGAGPSPEQRAARRTVVLGEVTDASGRRAMARQRHPDTYTVTALAAVEIAERVLRDEVRPGWQSPATAYGPDLVLALPGVSREDL